MTKLGNEVNEGKEDNRPLSGCLACDGYSCLG
jgi:hypothetical protein